MDATQHINAKIAKVQQVLELLKDPEVYAVVKSLVTDGTGQSPIEPHKVEKEPPPRGWRGSMAMTAYHCVKRMNGRFTRRELVKEVKAAGYEFLGRNPLMSMQRALDKLLYDKVIRIVEQGAGRRPTVYERRE